MLIAHRILNLLGNFYTPLLPFLPGAGSPPC